MEFTGGRRGGTDRLCYFFSLFLSCRSQYRKNLTSEARNLQSEGPNIPSTKPPATRLKRTVFIASLPYTYNSIFSKRKKRPLRRFFICALGGNPCLPVDRPACRQAGNLPSVYFLSLALYCALARIRTWNVWSEAKCDIHFTTRANEK